MKQIAHIRFLFVAFFALAAAQSVRADTFWLGTGQDSGNTDNWTGAKLLGDHSYIRDSSMTGTTYKRAMTLSEDASDTGKNLYFQAGTEIDPFTVTGNGRTLTLDRLSVGLLFLL